MKHKTYISAALVLAIIGCTLEPNITVEVPEGAVENVTNINVDWSDIGEYLAKQIEAQASCEFNELPNNEHGFVAKCTSNCCLWFYYDGTCLERWCLNLDNSCGWELTDWNCLASR